MDSVCLIGLFVYTHTHTLTHTHTHTHTYHTHTHEKINLRWCAGKQFITGLISGI